MRLLLVGGGHSHLAVLKSFGEARPPQASLVLLSPNRHALYSGMVPGLIAGHYALAECRIDLAPLAERAGARFLEDSAVGVHPGRREVVTAAGERLGYDILSLDVGSEASEPSGVRPIEPFLARWERLRDLAGRGEIRRIAVVGGGAAGIEVLLAMRHRLAARAVAFSLFSESPILAGHAEGARRRVTRFLGQAGVTVRVGQKVEDGDRLEAEAVVRATGARAPSWIGRSGLATDALGFVAVRGTLQSTSHADVFAAGDVAAAGLPKSGVFAVRQGPALSRNLRRALAGEALEMFAPPARALALISCGGRYAVASWGALAVEGAWVWRWKDRIDRRFVGQYRLVGTPQEEP